MLKSYSNRYSYLRAIREIEPSLALERFLGKVSHIGVQTLGFKDSTLVRRRRSLDEELSTLAGSVVDGIGLAHLQVYPANSLRLVQFERTLEAKPAHNTLIHKVIDRVVGSEQLERRLEGLAHDYGFIDQEGLREVRTELEVKAERVVDATRPQYAAKGEEFALTIADGEVASYLREEADILLDAIRHTGPGSEITHGIAPVAPYIAFMRAPTTASPEQKVELCEWVSQCLPRTGLPLTLMPLEWDSKLR